MALSDLGWVLGAWIRNPAPDRWQSPRYRSPFAAGDAPVLSRPVSWPEPVAA